MRSLGFTPCISLHAAYLENIQLMFVEVIYEILGSAGICAMERHEQIMEVGRIGTMIHQQM
jgi:hypothetical protein